MNDALRPSVSVGIKLASLVVHADELLDGVFETDGAGAFDVQAIVTLIADPEVVAYLDLLRPLALLPVKREARGG